MFNDIFEIERDGLPQLVAYLDGRLARYGNKAR